MEEKQIKNLFKKLINDQNSVFFSVDKINKTLLNKGKKSNYDKDKVFYKLFSKIENKNVIYDKEEEEDRLPFYTPFIPQKKNIDRSTLYSLNGPMQFFHADIAYLQFLGKSAVDPKYALVCVDLFTSKIYVYTMRKRSSLANKLEKFYQDIQKKRSDNEKMRLQTDQEFQQNEIKKINRKYNVEMFSSRIRGGKAFAAEQKIRELKKVIFKTKRTYKLQKKKINSKQIIEKAVENLNKTNSEKYGVAPETIEKKTLENDTFREIYDFYRLAKVTKDANRYERYNEKLDKKQKKKLREPLNIGEKVMVLAERIKKKDAPKFLFKSTTENVPFFNRKEIFKIDKYIAVNGTYNYWLQNEKGQKIDKRFIREELFALQNNYS